MIPQSLDELTANSTHIVRGQVVSVESMWDESGSTIFTEVLVDVSLTYKSTSALPQMITIRVPGGTVGETKLWVEHAAEFAVGEDVLTFLSDYGPALDVTSWTQGKFTIAQNTVAELNLPVTTFEAQIESVVDAERKRNGEEK
ncbi:MAG TPA: hypothetical protein VLB27_12375 [candidate division Zixibacteria bacterium]|nr:hypothetical protein [candidate division Zixibacteria bacterium]